MKLFSVAIGEKYEKEAVRLQRTVNLPIEVFIKSNDKYIEINKDPLINGLWHKCNFANYINEADGPVIFMDADMFTLTKDCFKNQQQNPLDPHIIRQEAFNHHGHKINSGFMYFRNLEIAKAICTNWAEEFLKRPLHWIKNEYDEYALMIALMNMNYKVEMLDSKWNDWELGLTSFEEKSPDSILNSNSIFFQSHDFLEIDKN